MPCYEVKINSVEFKAKNIEKLKTALKELGIFFNEYNGVISFGRFSINTKTETANYPRGEEDRINDIKMKYSEKMIQEIAMKKRWIFKMTQNNQGQIIKY